MEEKILNDATICFLIRDGKVLLAMKTEKIGVGCLNGYGGGIEPGETPEQCAIRELEEECSIRTLKDGIEKVAIMKFRNRTSDGFEFICTCHIFLIRKWKGEPKSSETMTDPTWFPVENLPIDKMMPADRLWLPPLLAGRKIIGMATYGPFQKELIGGVELEDAADFFEK